MNWTCPKCGRTLEVRRFPVRCCDVVDRGNGDVQIKTLPAEVVAQAIERQEEESQGLGDTVAKITKALGIKPCGGCNERRKLLNKLVPYGKK